MQINEASSVRQINLLRGGRFVYCLCLLSMVGKRQMLTVGGDVWLLALLLHKGFQPLHGFGRGDALAAVVEVDEYVAVVAHAKLFHV